MSSVSINKCFGLRNACQTSETRMGEAGAVCGVCAIQQPAGRGIRGRSCETLRASGAAEGSGRRSQPPPIKSRRRGPNPGWDMGAEEDRAGRCWTVWNQRFAFQCLCWGGTGQNNEFNVLLELLNSWKPGEVCSSVSLVPLSSFFLLSLKLPTPADVISAMGGRYPPHILFLAALRDANEDV